MQAALPETCGFAAQIRLMDIEVKSQRLSFKDPQTGYQYDLFRARDVAIGAPIGVWDFDSAGGDENGEGGIDYLFLDPKGYFLIQTTSGGELYLLVGYYSISGSSLTLTFFSGMDPESVAGTPLVYKQFVTDGTLLELVEETELGDVIYTGRRL